MVKAVMIERPDMMRVWMLGRMEEVASIYDFAKKLVKYYHKTEVSLGVTLTGYACKHVPHAFIYLSVYQSVLFCI